MSKPPTPKTTSPPPPLPQTEADMGEPQDMSLDEQVDIEPSREMDSQTEDFETKASVAGPIPTNLSLLTFKWSDFLR